MSLIDVFPPIPKVKRLLVVKPEVDGSQLDFWIWMRCLQGIVNRDEPHLYPIRDASVMRRKKRSFEEHWVDYYHDNYGVAVERQDDVDLVLERFKHLVDGYVVYDNEQVIQTQNLGITLAGLEDTIPVSPDQEDWMTRHSISKRDDLRGRFANNWDTAEWAVDNLWPRCNRRIYANFCIHRAHWLSASSEPADLVVYHRGMALDLPTSRQRRRVLNLYRRMLDEGEAPGVQLNWHCGYDQEKEYVAEAAQKGFVTLQTMFMPNMTVHGGVGDRDKVHIQPRPKPEECVGKPGGIYVSFYNSDGDAASVVHGMQSGNWVAPDRGKFKFGWGFLPMTAKLMPAMMDYYHETRTENDCLFGPSSGAGYTYSRMWPEHLRSTYYKDTLQLLRQTGQNGCNMVNWFLQDWWREAEDDEGVRREQSELEELTGLVCGLGGSPYAKSYLDGPVPKIHCVDIANVGRDNIANVLKLAEECPTRPLFVFLFAQISVGIWEQLESEMPLLEEHPEIEIVSMDEFLLTVRDATDRGLLGSELYETNEAMAERWLKQPGRHRLPIAEKVADELASVAHSDPEERRRHLAVAGWTDLVSRTLEDVAGNKEKFLTYFLGRSLAFSEDEEADALLYSAFTLAWHVVRAAIETQGIYANHRTQCLDDFVRTCGNIADVSVIKELFAAWDEWENGTPPLETIVGWCDGLAAATRELHDALGPNESEAAYESWPPRSI